MVLENTTGGQVRSALHRRVAQLSARGLPCTWMARLFNAVHGQRRGALAPMSTNEARALCQHFDTAIAVPEQAWARPWATLLLGCADFIRLQTRARSWANIASAACWPAAGQHALHAQYRRLVDDHAPRPAAGRWCDTMRGHPVLAALAVGRTPTSCSPTHGFHGAAFTAEQRRRVTSSPGTAGRRLRCVLAHLDV